jgi:hypothetical protein
MTPEERQEYADERRQLELDLVHKLEGISLVPEYNYWRAKDPGQTRSMILAARQATGGV